jgi:murein DD-endopeptidase MepM/ murein hydrolase activator NlpD
LNPRKAVAVAYCFEAKKGHKIEISVRGKTPQRIRLFLDLFRKRGSSPEEFVLVASSPQQAARIEFEPRQDSLYVVRLQPELLRGGRFVLTIRKKASLSFPVQGRDSRAIQSGFGAPRDGGRREHHGVDIFAPRHTPVLAPSDAYVRRVGESEIGGNTVWLHDSKRSLYLYFAHLQTQDIEEYSYVKRGQIIGTVGNTGNAKTTPPHLHFGIYMRGSGAVDPYHFITPPDGRLAAPDADETFVGHWMRVGGTSLSMRDSLSGKAKVITKIERDSVFRVLASSGRMYRIVLPNGVSGYIRAEYAVGTQEPLHTDTASVTLELSEKPGINGSICSVIESGETYAVLGFFEALQLVQSRTGDLGWMKILGADPSA